MAAGARVKITLRCEECKQRNYNTVRSVLLVLDRVVVSQMRRMQAEKHTKHVETK